MRFVWKLLSRVGSAALILGGLGLLGLIAFHRTPWDMTRLVFSPETGIVRVAEGFEFSPLALYGGLMILAFATITLLPWTRNLFRQLAVRPRRWLPGLAGVSYLTFTLVPSDKGAEIVLELVFGTLGIGMLTTGLVHSWATLPRHMERLGRWAGRSLEAASPKLIAGLVFGVAFGAANLGSLYVFGHIPHIVDAADQLFHAKIFLQGLLFAPSPEAGEFFSITHMIDNGRWYSQYPPGHTMLLAAGQAIRAPWLVNPLCGALSAVLLYRLGRTMFDERTGRLAAILGAMSPFLLLMSSSFMSHATTLLFLELFMLGVVGLLARERPIDGLVAGLGLGVALNIRPMSAAAVAAPFLLYAAYRAIARSYGSGSRASARFYASCLIAAVVCLALVGGLLAFNQATNGDPFVFGYEVLHGKESRPGFGNGGWWDTPHTPRRGLTWTMENFNAVNLVLLGWPVPSLMFALLGLAWSRAKVWDWLLLASASSLALAYFFYWYHDWALGPRFLYCASGPLLLLTARGLSTFPAFLRRVLAPATAIKAMGSVFLALLLCFGYMLVVTVPSMASYYSRNYADGNAAILRAVDEREHAGMVVFTPSIYYPTVFPRNDPLLRGPVIYARDYGLEPSRKLMRLFPDRSALRLVAWDDYALMPYDDTRFSEPLTWELPPTGSLTVEFSTSQASFIRNGFWRDQRMGDWGGKWKNHDQLLITAREKGARTGLLIRALESRTASINLLLSRGPEYGIAQIRFEPDGTFRTIDLYAPELETLAVSFQDVNFRAGVNRLSLLVVGKNDASRSFGMGLDFVSIR